MYDISLQIQSDNTGLRFVDLLNEYNRMEFLDIDLEFDQYLVQMFLKCLFTKKGSDPTDRDYGTVLYTVVKQPFSDEDSNTSAVQDALRDALKQIKVFQRNFASVPDSDRLLQKAIVNSVSNTGGTLNFSCTLFNRYGNRLPFTFGS